MVIFLSTNLFDAYCAPASISFWKVSIPTDISFFSISLPIFIIAVNSDIFIFNFPYCTYLFIHQFVFLIQYFFVCVSIVNDFRIITHNKLPIFFQFNVLDISLKIFNRF